VLRDCLTRGAPASSKESKAAELQKKLALVQREKERIEEERLEELKVGCTQPICMFADHLICLVYLLCVALQFGALSYVNQLVAGSLH
jgi:hypothetical protein